MIGTILMVLALVLFVLAAFEVVSSRVNLVAAGLACWVLAQLLAGWGG